MYVAQIIASRPLINDVSIEQKDIMTMICPAYGILYTFSYLL